MADDDYQAWSGRLITTNIMYQLVNLYQPVLRRQPKLLSAATLITIIAIVLVLLFALYLNAQSTLQALQSTSKNLDQNYTQLEARLGAVSSVADFPVSTTISDEVTTLQAQINDRIALIEKIDNLFIDTEVGFGDVFESLAQSSLPGLWLTGIQLEQDGSIEISGTTLDPKLVPRYLQMISQYSPLHTLNGGTVNLIREDTNEPEIDFVLSYTSHGEAQ